MPDVHLPAMIPETPTDSQLWSWVDRDASELEAYMQQSPAAAARVAAVRGTIASIARAGAVPARIGGFRIEGVLGRGGMGVVYAAAQDEPRRAVALKVLPPALGGDARWLERFRREADALARLSHPGICAVHEFGQEDGAVYIAMQRVAGRPLQDWLADDPDPRRRLRLAQALCAAVGHAHDQGVVHRDLKPGNVLVTGDDRPVVIDFGLASFRDATPPGAAQLTAAGSVLGTLPYMSPEQVAGTGAVDARADVYSLGVVLCELFTGAPPYDLSGLSLVAAARQISHAPPRPHRGLRGDLRLVVLQALAKDPAARYASAGELAADLQRCLDGRLVEARRASVVRRSLHFVGRHRLAVAAGVGLLLLSFLLLFPAWLPARLGGKWWWRGAPFAALRWDGDRPQVEVRGRWYALREIQGLHADYVVGFCKQTAQPTAIWRKRFSEDLVQVLNRLGVLCYPGLALKLEDLETGEAVRLDDVDCSGANRQRIWEDRNSWPWPMDPAAALGSITLAGRRYELLGIDGVPFTEICAGQGAVFMGAGHMGLYDAYCARVGRSPGPTVDLRVRDPGTGEERLLRHQPRRWQGPR